MEFESSSLYREVTAIVAGAAKPVHYRWGADIHVAGETYAALKVLSVDIAQDYEGNYGDEIILTVALSGGTYANRVYPNQSNMDITLYRTPIGETSDAVNENQQPQSERYTATLLDKGNPGLEGNAPIANDEEALNLTNIVEISFQLVNKALEQLRMITLSGIFRGSTVEEVVKNVLTQGSQSVHVDGARMPQGVDMVPASNVKARDHVIIPEGRRLVDIPQYIHNRCGGIYSAGLGYYMQGDFWYVYPCYDVTRFNKAAKTLTVINVPPNKLPGIERTYRQDGKNLVILATGEVRYRDDTDAQQLNSGNGVRFADANKFMGGFALTQQNKSLLSRGGNASEFLSIKRPNGMNNVQMSKDEISANPFVQFSALARRQGSFLSFVWENSLPELIFPGMPTKMMYMKDDLIEEVEGVVLKCHHFVTLRGQGLTASRYQTMSSISMFVKPSDNH